jgi:hypothetical protein
MSRLPGLRFVFACALLPLAASCQAGAAPAPKERPALGLMGTIPIYWGEAGDLGDLVGGRGAGHWARERLEARFELEPLDTLSAETLAGVRLLLLAQPRALSPAENVALDAWVRQGGKLLLFADPMLTGHSRFPIGDRRRPQDVILLSPILDHWGLRLEFDDDRPEGVALAQAGPVAIPVDRPGAFARGENAGDCTLSARNVLARCRIGQGDVTVWADAAVLDLHDPDPAAAPALDWLVEQAFALTGEIAGQTR